MTTETQTNVPTEQDAIDAINAVIDDYVTGIQNTLADLGKNVNSWVAQAFAFAHDFSNQLDANAAVVTGVTLEKLASYEGPLAPILLNSVTKFVQVLDDAANRKLAQVDTLPRLQEVIDALQEDLMKMEELSEPALQDELFIIRRVVRDVSEELEPYVNEGAANMADAIIGYIEEFLLGVETGTEGDDEMVGGNGDNKMFGLDGDDTMDGGWGDDQMFGGQGNDLMMGGFGHDTMHGGDDDDEMHGDAGNDQMSGEDGADALHGGYGDDALDGGIGNDHLDGGANNDVITGGDGADLIIGGYGQDILTGGEGEDTFVFNDFSGKDVITDFESGVDSIEIAGFTWSFNNLNVRQVGENTEIAYSFATIVLEDTDAATITASDFDFV